MDKISKFLKMLSGKERAVCLTILEKIVRGDFDGLDVKKLRGEKNLYRVRTGNIRIIFRKPHREIVSIGLRKDVYKKFL